MDKLALIAILGTFAFYALYEAATLAHHVDSADDGPTKVGLWVHAVILMGIALLVLFKAVSLFELR